MPGSPHRGPRAPGLVSKPTVKTIARGRAFSAPDTRCRERSARVGRERETPRGRPVFSYRG